MRTIRVLSLLLLTVLCVTACHQGKPLYGNLRAEADSLPAAPDVRPYALNSNFRITADTLWLHELPFTDSLAVYRGDELVVAECAVHPEDSIDSLWVKVARDQATMGWIQEHKLLENIVPVDPISQAVHWFSSRRTLAFFVVLGIFFLWTVVRAIRRKQLRLVWANDIDSMFPVILSWLLAFAATLYNTLQSFMPLIWQRYYYAPSLNPFEQPFILGLFVLCVWLIVLFGIALVDDIFRQTRAEVALFYLSGLASACIFLYIFFTHAWIYLAYLCFAAYTVGCIWWLRRASRYPYACGACGAKMRKKGICPHCGALNE